MGASYDLVVVGAGSAGCVIAARASEDPGCRVLLLEAGETDRSMFIRMPASAALAARDPQLTWGYLSEPEPGLDDREIQAVRGKVLGGSSSVNGMVANRGNPRDYDGWAAAPARAARRVIEGNDIAITPLNASGGAHKSDLLC